MISATFLSAIFLASCVSSERVTRHYFGENGTVPQTLANLGTVNIKGYGDVYVVTGSPGNVDKLDNGFRLHGGGGVYLATKNVDIGTDPFMYWQVKPGIISMHV